MSLRRIWSLLLTLGAVALSASPALGAADMETGIADDAVLLAGGDVAATAVGDWRRMGVDVVRIHVRWVTVAPGDDEVVRPSAFNARDPEDPQYDWGAIDNAVALLRDAGIRPMLAITGSGPLWTSAQPSRGNPRFKPSPSAFADFAHAVATRYGFAADRYLIWNEPNQPAWLQPQFDCVGSRCSPVAPHLYRELFRAGYGAVRAADPGAQVLIGTLSPSGRAPSSKNAVMRPLQFLRALGCVDDKRLRRLRTGACRTAKPVRAEGFAYHPHPVRFSPDTRSTNPDNAAIADLSHFESVLDKVTRNGIIRPTTGPRFNLYLTEFGYQTNPPDRDSGVTLLQQSAWLQQSWFKAWSDRRVKNITQYEWVDEPIKLGSGGNNLYASWQSGLFFSDGRAKPALLAFPNPFFIRVTPGETIARFWGQVRPGGQWTVLLEKQTADGSWVPLQSLATDERGFWHVDRPVTARGVYRFSYEIPVPGDPQAPPFVAHSATQAVKPLRAR